jgi:hypothetical protein
MMITVDNYDYYFYVITPIPSRIPPHSFHPTGPIQKMRLAEGLAEGLDREIRRWLEFEVVINPTYSGPKKILITKQNILITIRIQLFEATGKMNEGGRGGEKEMKDQGKKSIKPQFHLEGLDLIKLIHDPRLLLSLITLRDVV